MSGAASLQMELGTRKVRSWNLLVPEVDIFYLLVFIRPSIIQIFYIMPSMVFGIDLVPSVLCCFNHMVVALWQVIEFVVPILICHKGSVQTCVLTIIDGD